MSGPLSDQHLAAIRDRDKALYSSRSARDLVHQDRHILLQLLDEMTLCRDNAIRAAQREDTAIEFHLGEQLRDGLAGVAEWEHPGEPDQAPDWLINAIVRVVRPELARLTEQRDHLTSAFDKLGDQMGELVQAARSERDRYTAENQRLRAMLDDAAGYLAAIHRHASRHDVLGKDLGCAGCELLARIEGAPAEPDRVPPRTPTPGRSDAHFSPGYTGEIPDHHGVFATCAMPACVTSRARHENGGEP